MDVNAEPGIQGGLLVPVAFVCFLVRGIHGGGFEGVVALKALIPEREEVGYPVRTLCHRDLLECGVSVLGICDGTRGCRQQG